MPGWRSRKMYLFPHPNRLKKVGMAFVRTRYNCALFRLPL
jgi:hypothetical protein